MNIFGITAPGGACKVRLKTKFKRTGGTPVVLCDTVSEEAVQVALDESRTLAKYFGYFNDKELGPKPWTFKADLTFLGSDGEQIDQPKEVECTYYGPDKPGGTSDGTGAALLAAVNALKEIAIEGQKTDQAKLTAFSQVFSAGADKSAEAAAKILAAGAGPLEKAVAAIEKVGDREHTRANDATKDVATLLQRQNKPPAKTVTEQLGDVSKALLPWVPVVKGLFGPN